MFKDKLQIWVFDTRIAAYGEARLALEAERALKQNQKIPGIMSQLMLMRSQQAAFMTVGKLDYLVKSGRLSAAAGFIGNLMQMRPVLQMTDGAITPHAKVRTLERALEAMINSAHDYANSGHYRVHMIKFGVESTNHLLQDLLGDHFPAKSWRSTSMTPVIAAHTGPDGAGLIVWRVAA